MKSFAKALEIIPRTLAQNAGLDSVAILIKLRTIHAKNTGTPYTPWLAFNILPLLDGKWEGVDITSPAGHCNSYDKFIWEPELVRRNALIAATEVAKP